jgi:hypothetical protein
VEVRGKVLGRRLGGKLGKVNNTVLNWTLFGQKYAQYLLTVKFSELSEKGPLPVRISDRGGGLHQVIPPNFAVKGAATDL